MASILQSARNQIVMLLHKCLIWIYAKISISYDELIDWPQMFEVKYVDLSD